MASHDEAADAVRAIERLPAELSEPAAWLDPFDWYAETRERRPIRYDDDRDCWDLFRYADVDAVLDDPDTFASNPNLARAIDVPEDSPITDTMLTTDGARHDRLRAVVEEPFRPRALAGRVGRFEEIAGDLLDDALDGGRFDLVDAVAVPFPVTVIAELLGVPATDHDRFRRWSETLVTTPSEDADPETVRERRAETTEELTDYLGGHVEERRTDPRGDVLSTLAHAVAEGRLDGDEAVGTAMLLLVAGNVTTTNLIGNAIRCLAAHPAEAARFRDGEVPVEGLVEEVLRYRSPVQALSRVATREVGVAGETIAPGDLVVPWLGAANRDPRRFDAPEDFRIDRAPNPHLGFGRGTHYCLGAPLARMETRIVLGELFDRVRSVSVATDDLEPVRSSFLHGVESLPVTVDPR